jgi:hypothetical protein
MSIHEKFCSPKLATALLSLALLAASGASPAAGDPNPNPMAWANAPADLTIGEYLEIQFRLSPLQRSENNALNDFSLVSFYPSLSPESAVVVVIQTWHDERARPQDLQDLRREIRKVGEALSQNFDATVHHPAIRDRWKNANSRANLIVKHVRYSDVHETLGVTIRGETVFDPESIAKAKIETISRMAVWDW